MNNDYELIAMKIEDGRGWIVVNDNILEVFLNIL